MPSSLSPAKQALLARRLRHGHVGGSRPAQDAPVTPLPRAAGGDPPSYAQQRLWLLDALVPGLTAYNVVRAVRLSGPLDRVALRVALGAVLARHEVLRSRIVDSGDGPRVLVTPPEPVGLPVTDLRGQRNRELTVRSVLATEADRPFDLAHDLLLRARLLLLEDRCSVLVLSTHHIASDEGSRAVLFTDLATAYTAAVEGRPPDLPPLPVQYADWATWQRRRLDSAGVAEHIEWWRERLAGAPATLDVQGERAVPPTPNLPGGRYLDMMGPADAAAVKALARRHRVTLFMTVVAGYAALLSRYSGADDLVVGCPVSGRTAETAALIGCFSNLVPLRVELGEDPTFAELLGRVRRTVTEAVAHADVPFERLVEELSAARDPERNPIFQAAVSFENAVDVLPHFPGLLAETVEVSPAQAKFELAVVASDQHSGGVRLEWEYTGQRFSEAIVAHMSHALRHLLTQAAAAPAIRLSELSLPPAEQLQLASWGAPAARTSRPTALPTLPRRVVAQAGRRPDAPAVSGPDGNLTYGELRSAVSEVSERLRGLGVGPGDRVAVCLDRSAMLVVALLGVLEASAAYVPVDPAYPPDRVQGMLADAGVAAMVTSTAVLGRLPPAVLPVRRLVLDGAPAEMAPTQPVAGGGGPDGGDAAYVIYTSGSTGAPKGVVVEHRSLSNLLDSMAAEPGMRAGDVLLAVTTPSFDIAALEMFLPLWVGGRVAMASTAEATDPYRLAAALDSVGATIMQATPASWQMLVDAGLPGRRNLRALCGGEALPGALAARLSATCAEVWNLYGPTETTIWSMASRVDNTDLDPLPLGRPIAGTRLYVVDSHDRLAPVGVPGELLIAGRGVARGYWRRPELTAQRFVTLSVTGGRRAYRTGDRVRWRTDGRLEFLGRLDAQVKLRGHRIELGEVEAALRGVPGVTEAVVVRREDRPGDARLVGYLTGGPAVDTSAARRLLTARLPAHMVPARLVYLERLPRTPNGKVDRTALLPPEEPKPGERVSRPRGPVEDTVAGWWRELLGVEPVNPADDFFDLGGHSLLLMSLAARMKRECGVAMPLRRLYEASTFGGMAEALASELIAGDPGDLAALLAELDRTGER